MKKSASQRDKKPLVKSSREQGATVTTPRSNGSNPAHILGTRRLHDVFTKVYFMRYRYVSGLGIAILILRRELPCGEKIFNGT